MNDTQTIPDSVLDEMLGNDVPCDDCGSPAQLRSIGHRCVRTTPPHHKCVKCYQYWLTKNRYWFSQPKFPCRHCDQWFSSLREFSDYREF